MRKILIKIALVCICMVLSGYGGYKFRTTIQKSFFYEDEKINFAFKYTNTALETKIFKLSDRCHSSFRIFDLNANQVYPTKKHEVLCSNYSQNYVYLAPRQSIVFKHSFDAKNLSIGSYLLQGFVSNLQAGEYVSFEIIKRPSLNAGLNQGCGPAINKVCEIGLSCNFNVSSVKDMGICVRENSGQILNNKVRLQDPYMYTDSLFVLQNQNSVGFEDQILNTDDLSLYNTELVSIQDFRQIVFNKAFTNIEIKPSQQLITRQQAIFLLYTNLYSRSYPTSLNGIFYLDTINSNYRDYIDWAYSKGITSNKDKYFYPDRFLTRGELLIWIKNFLKLKD